MTRQFPERSRGAVVALLLCACARPPDPVPGPPPSELAFDDVRFSVYRKGEASLRVNASHVDLMRTTGALTAKDARFDFQLDALTLSAPVLTGNVNSLSFDATGGVVIASTDGTLTAKTPTAHFEGREGKRGVATGHDPIAVRGTKDGRPFALDARAFTFDVEAQHATFDAPRSKVGGP